MINIKRIFFFKGSKYNEIFLKSTNYFFIYIKKEFAFHFELDKKIKILNNFFPINAEF